MSTAFMVDNILSVRVAKGDDPHSAAESLSSDTDSDATSDIKDSLCGSPHSDSLMMPVAGDIMHDKPLNISESLLRTYAMMRNSGQFAVNGGGGGGIDAIIGGGNGGGGYVGGVGVSGGGGGGVELCCGKCGHFQVISNRKHQQQQHHRSLATACDDSADSVDAAIDFKCDKCGGTDAVIGKVVSDDAKECISSDGITATGATMMMNGGNSVTKPILKFSVSAILGDRKECVKVRNGKVNEIMLCWINVF